MKTATDNERGFAHELAFWADFVQTERFQNNWVKAPTNPELDSLTRQVILAEAGGRPKVLDVGAGPVSILRGLVKKLTAIDPLASEFSRLVPGCKTIAGHAEHLPFEDVFDVVHIRNAFDHTQNPLLAILSLVRAARPGGLIFIQGFVDEASHEQYAGLHQWNVTAAGNVLSVTGREYSFRYEPAPDAMVLSRVVQLPTEKEWFYFAFRKPKK